MFLFCLIPTLDTEAPHSHASHTLRFFIPGPSYAFSIFTLSSLCVLFSFDIYHSFLSVFAFAIVQVYDVILNNGMGMVVDKISCSDGSDNTWFSTDQMCMYKLCYVKVTSKCRNESEKVLVL